MVPLHLLFCAFTPSSMKHIQFNEDGIHNKVVHNGRRRKRSKHKLGAHARCQEILKVGV